MEMIAPLCRPVIQFRTDTKMPYEVAYVTLTFQKSAPLNLRISRTFFRKAAPTSLC